MIYIVIWMYHRLMLMEILSITWSVGRKNGSTYSGPTSTTNLPDDTIPGSQVSLNDNWSCEIHADDGVDSVNSVLNHSIL